MRQHASCERARQWTSLRLDGELSQLEQVMLAHHIARCEDCRTFAADVGAFHLLITNAPLEQLERPVELPRRERGVLWTRLGVLAPAAAAVAALGIALGAWPGSEQKTRSHVPISSSPVRFEIPTGQAVADISLVKPNVARQTLAPRPQPE